MKIRTRTLGVLAGLLSCFALMAPATAQDRPYTEGTVSVVASIRTAPGQTDNYMRYLATTYRQMMEEQKKLGNVVDWSVYMTRPRTADDPDLYLVTTYKNLAAMDGLQDKVDAVQAKIIGNQEARDASMAARNAMRTQIGSEVIRKVEFK